MQLRNLTVISPGRLVSLLVATTLLAGLPATAEAAKLNTSRPCYRPGETLPLSGTGFAPDSRVRIKVNSERVGFLPADAEGRIDGQLTVPTDPPRVEIRARDPRGNTATKVLFGRDATLHPPSASNATTWQAAFRLFGFFQGKAFVHYISPKGKHKKTVALGRLRGRCGRLKTERRRVLPFSQPALGEWQLQIDTRRVFDPRTSMRRIIKVSVFR